MLWSFGFSPSLSCTLSPSLLLSPANPHPGTTFPEVDVVLISSSNTTYLCPQLYNFHVPKSWKSQDMMSPFFLCSFTMKPEIVAGLSFHEKLPEFSCFHLTVIWASVQSHRNLTLFNKQATVNAKSQDASSEGELGAKVGHHFCCINVTIDSFNSRHQNNVSRDFSRYGS